MTVRVNSPRRQRRPAASIRTRRSGRSGSRSPTSIAHGRSTSARSACGPPSSRTARSGSGAPGEPPLIELRGDSAAPRLNRRAPGSITWPSSCPTRLDLAFALARLAQARWPLDGASDHLVSEALYLSDPDGNGIEIYRDRPRAEWPRTGDQLEMATLPLDLDDILGELRGGVRSSRPRLPTGTRIGHVHLQVSDLSEAEAFYRGVLGFDVMVRGYPGALFVSAGGYHHHIGLNTWHSAGSPPTPAGSVGLRSFDRRAARRARARRVLARVESAGIPTAAGGGRHAGARPVRQRRAPDRTPLSVVPAAGSRGPGRTAVATLGTPGDVAEWLRSGLQSRLHRFDSGRRL